MHCPHPALGHGLDSAHARRTAIEFLVSELQATQILRARERHQGGAEGARAARGGEEETRGEGKAGTEEGRGEARAVDKDTGDSGEMERELLLLCRALDLQPSSLLTVVQGEVVSRLARLPGGAPPRPLLKLPLTSEQWARMEEIHQALRQEYECRRHMMIKRFQVTVGSFHWGERGQDRSRLMSTVLQPLESALSPLPATSLCHLLATREDQSRIVATSCGEARRVTCCAVNKVLMGSVPDRGGRPGEIEPPMPSWGARRQGGGGRGGRRYSGKKKNKKKE
ncbi:protein FAM98C isoform X2 [Lepisosteus oculatus]